MFVSFHKGKGKYNGRVNRLFPKDESAGANTLPAVRPYRNGHGIVAPH